MTSNHHANQLETGTDNTLTLLELIEIALYTVQKIDNYPKSCEKTVDNYFHILFPDEIKAYLLRREINAKSIDKINVPCCQNNECQTRFIQLYTKKVQDIKLLCQLLVEQQNNILQLISDKLDELEAELNEANADKECTANDS